MTDSRFASRGDTAARSPSFTRIVDGVFVYATPGDPNSGVVVGSEAVLVVDVQATPARTRRLRDQIAQVTDLPVKYLVLTHHHAARTHGAGGLGAVEIVTSQSTRDLLAERGKADYISERQRFPKLFEDPDDDQATVHPTLTFDTEATLSLGGIDARVVHPGRGHSGGDVVVWIGAHRVLFAGDLVAHGVSPYAGDAHFRDWDATVDGLASYGAEILVPGRGDVAVGAQVTQALDATRLYLDALWDCVRTGIARGDSLRTVYLATKESLEPRYGGWSMFNHCLPFNVARAYEEGLGIREPRVWTDTRDWELWRELEGLRTAHPGGPEMPQVLADIKSEHLSFHTLTHLFAELVTDLEAGRIVFDAELFGLILDYIGSYMDEVHHPKEDDVLFAELRARLPDTGPLLDRLHRQHLVDQGQRSKLNTAFEAARDGRDGAVKEFCDLAHAYLSEGRDHTRLEEETLIPQALARLDPVDWVEIDRKYATRDGIDHGPELTAHYRALLRRITYLAPEPHGLGGRG